MKALLVQCQCNKCATTFLRPILSDFAYGEFLLWSRGGAVAYLSVFDDPTYDEVNDIASRLAIDIEAKLDSGYSLVLAIFGEAACDPDETGSPYRVAEGPYCPGCGRHEFLSWATSGQEESSMTEVFAVSHHGWNKLAFEEKEAALTEVAAKYGCR